MPGIQHLPQGLFLVQVLRPPTSFVRPHHASRTVPNMQYMGCREGVSHRRSRFRNFDLLTPILSGSSPSPSWFSWTHTYRPLHGRRCGGRAWVCCALGFLLKTLFFQNFDPCQQSENLGYFRDPHLGFLCLLTTPLSTTGCYMGEPGRGRRELVFARSDMCQNLSPTAESLSCAAPPPSLPGCSIRGSN